LAKIGSEKKAVEEAWRNTQKKSESAGEKNMRVAACMDQRLQEEI